MTKRQIQLLKYIIDEYTFSATPVSSKEIIEKYMPDFSSATIRNEMKILEDEGYLEKTHTSSGRVPSLKGYQYYEKNIIEPKVSESVQKRLMKIFYNRELSIDTIINQSVAIISETLKLPSIIASFDEDDTLKRFDLIQLSKNDVMIIVVTASGNINKNIVKFNQPEQLEDIITCIRIFNDRLIDTPLRDVNSKVLLIKEIIRKHVHQYEYVIQQLVEKLFNNNQNIPQNTSVQGTKYLTTQPEFKDIEKLNRVLDLLEGTNVWKNISYEQAKTGKTLITFGSQFGNDNVAVASTNIKLNNSSHKLAIVGPTRMNYTEVKALLDLLKEEIEKIDHEKDN